MLRRWFWHIFVAGWLGSIWVAASLGQTSTPTITSLQSSPVTSNIPTLGNAITSATNIPGFRLYINGNFTLGATETVTWQPVPAPPPNTSTPAPTTFTAQNGIQSITANQIVVFVPSALFSAPVSSQVTINVTVTEQIFTNTGALPPVTSNPSPFFINPPMTATGPVLPTGIVGTAYSAGLMTGGTAPFTATAPPGTLPAGLSLPQVSGAAATAVLGTPAVINVSAGTPATVTANPGVTAAATATGGTQATVVASQGSAPSVTFVLGTTATGTVVLNPTGGFVSGVTITNAGSGYPAGATNIPMVITQGTCKSQPTAVGNTDSGGHMLSVTITSNGVSNCAAGTGITATFPNAGIATFSFAPGTGFYDAAPNLNAPGIAVGATNTSATVCNQASPGFAVPQLTSTLGANNRITSVTLTNPGYGCTATPTVTFPPPGLQELCTNTGTAYGAAPTVTLTGTTCTVNPTFAVGVNSGGNITFTQTSFGTDCTQFTNPVVETPGILSVNVTNGGSAYQSAPAASIAGGTCAANPTFSVAAPTAGSLASGTGTITVSNGNYGVGCPASSAVTVGPPGILSVTVNSEAAPTAHPRRPAPRLRRRLLSGEPLVRPIRC